MSGASLGVLAAGLLASTALLAALTLGRRSLPEVLVAAYVLAFAEVVVLTLVVSPLAGVRRPVLLVSMTAALVGALVMWSRAGRPTIAGPRVAGLPRTAGLGVVVVLLGVAGVGALLYATALVVGTPPSNWDSLTYHLARAAFWRQSGGVGYVDNPYDGRLNANPPNGEIALAFALEITRTERAAGFVQLTAWIASAVAVVAVARRVGLSRAQAAFGGLLFLLLPIVLLESSTTQNDLVLTAMLLAATTFLMGATRSELVLGAIAVALAVGVKVTALLALPILFAVVLMAPRPARRAARFVALAVGSTAGSYWYVVNGVETGDPLGNRPDSDVLAIAQPRENLLAMYARALDALELTGVRDWGVDAYLLAGVLFFAALLGLALRGHITRRSAIVAGSLYFAVLVIYPLSYLAWRVFAKVHDILEAPDRRLPVKGWPSQTLANEDQSWFGPVGLALVVALAVVGPVLVRRRRMPALVGLFALAPIAWLLLVSATLEYDPWQGRFFMYPVALSASLWGVVLWRPAVAWATAAVSVTIAAVSLGQYHQKPLSVWRGSERWEVQTMHRSVLAPVHAFVDEQIPAKATVALALSENDFGYPMFGPRLQRRLVLVPFGTDAADVTSAWLVANPGRSDKISRACWSRVLHDEGGSVFRRRTPDCVAPALERHRDHR